MGMVGEEPTGEPMGFKAPARGKRSPLFNGTQEQKEPIEEPMNAKNKNDHLASSRKCLKNMVSRDGFEPSARRLKVCCSAN